MSGEYPDKGQVDAIEVQQLLEILSSALLGLDRLEVVVQYVGSYVPHPGDIHSEGEVLLLSQTVQRNQ